MSRVIVILLALFIAVHISIGPFPAPVPVFLGFAAVIVYLGYAVWVASGYRLEWRTAT